MSKRTNHEANLPANEHLFATFFLYSLEFAIDVGFVQDAIPQPDHIIPLPSSPEYISGIIDLRNKIVPIIDTRKRFRMSDSSKQGNGHIAIIRCKGRYIGLTFDQISEVIRVKRESMEALAPEFQKEKDLLGDIVKLENGKRLLQVINPHSLFDYKDLPAHLLQSTEKKEGEKSIAARKQVVAFQVAEQIFGIPVKYVREILVTPEISQRILVEEYILGVISLRNELLSIIDLRRFLEEKSVDRSGDSRVLILQIDDFSFGILVDSINEVVTYKKRDLQPMPSWSGNKHAGGFRGVLERSAYSLVLLDVQSLFAKAIKRLSEHVHLHGADSSTSAKHGKGEGEQENPPVTFITFQLDEVYGVEITHLREIVRYEDNIRYLPGQVDYIQGILNLRSEVIPVINMRNYFKKPSPDKKESLIMIFTHEEKQIGILIDRLLEIRTLSITKEDNIPHLIARQQTRHCHDLVERVIKIEDRKGKHIPVMILDVRKFYQEMTSNNFSKAELEVVEQEAIETAEGLVEDSLRLEESEMPEMDEIS